MTSALFQQLVIIRRQLHANPELGCQEFQTSKLITDELMKLSTPFEANVAGRAAAAR